VSALTTGSYVLLLDENGAQRTLRFSKQ